MQMKLLTMQVKWKQFFFIIWISRSIFNSARMFLASRSFVLSVTQWWWTLLRSERNFWGFSRRKWEKEISTRIYGTQKVFSFSRAHFYYGSKKWFIVLIGSFFQWELKPLFWNGRWETSCGKFDKKPFLIRFRNRKYPFLFHCKNIWMGRGLRSGKRWTGYWEEQTKSTKYSQNANRFSRKLLRFYRLTISLRDLKAFKIPKLCSFQSLT